MLYLDDTLETFTYDYEIEDNLTLVCLTSQRAPQPLRKTWKLRLPCDESRSGWRTFEFPAYDLIWWNCPELLTDSVEIKLKTQAPRLKKEIARCSSYNPNLYPLVDTCLEDWLRAGVPYHEIPNKYKALPKQEKEKTLC